MSGSCSGVQQQLREVSPCAVYIHCYAHKLNLALGDCVKSIQFTCDFCCLLEALYEFISTSKTHTVFVAKQLELHPEKQIHQLQKLSDTRWTCRQGAVNAVSCTYDSLFILPPWKKCQREQIELKLLSQMAFFRLRVLSFFSYSSCLIGY